MIVSSETNTVPDDFVEKYAFKKWKKQYNLWKWKSSNNNDAADLYLYW